MSLAQIREHARGRLEGLGNAVTSQVWRLGFASRFLFYMVVHSGTAVRRFRLTVAEIYFAGVLSLIIILVSGLFVGMVLALQGYETLQRFGASESLGVLVALSLVRELGPVVAGLLFASRAGSATHRGDRPDEGHRADLGHGNDGGRPDRARGGAALLGRRAVDAAARRAVLGRRRVRRLPGGRAAHRRRRRRVLVADAGGGGTCATTS